MATRKTKFAFLLKYLNVLPFWGSKSDKKGVCAKGFPSAIKKYAKEEAVQRKIHLPQSHAVQKTGSIDKN